MSEALFSDSRMNTSHRHSLFPASAGVFMRMPNITLHRLVAFPSLHLADRPGVVPSESWAGRSFVPSNQAFQRTLHALARMPGRQHGAAEHRRWASLA